MTWNARHTALVEEENTCDCTAVARFPPWLSMRPSPLIVKAASNFSAILQRAVAVLQVIDFKAGNWVNQRGVCMLGFVTRSWSKS